MNLKLFSLLLINLTSRILSYTLEEVIRDSVEKGLKSLTQLKTQLPESDEDLGDFIGSEEKDYQRDDTVPAPVCRASVVEQAANTKTKNSNCSCEFHKQEKPKRTTIVEKYDRSEENRSDVTIKESIGSTLNPTFTFASVSKAQLKDAHFELDELEFQLHSALREVCPHYKKISDLDIESMADVWQLAYYKAEHVLYCFKIFLKKISPQSRKRNKIKYTSFNNSIDWQECFLELGSTGIHQNNRKHFLQGSTSDNGVLENIVLSQSVENDFKIITLEDQSPDQWLVSKNVLLMRDCSSGDVIIFTRITFKPDSKELEEAMYEFGENGMNDTKQCQIHTDGTKFKQYVDNSKYNTLS